MNCHNGEKYLRESINSVLSQTYQDWELIFWDNKSCDNSAKIILSYPDGRIKYFLSNEHTKLYEARNLAIEKSKGKYLAFLDVDDYWEPTKLQKQISTFSKGKNLAIVYSNYYFKNEIKNSYKKASKNKLPEGMILDQMLKKFNMALLTVVIDRDVFQEFEIFDPSLHFIGDFDMTIKVTSKHRVSCVQEPLATYRWHGSNESILKKDLQIKEMEKWAEKIMAYDEISKNRNFKKVLNDIKYFRAMSFVMNGDLKNAFKLYSNLTFGKEKLKLFFSLLLPLKIIKILRT